MRNLLLLSYPFPPDNTAAATRPGQLSVHLPEVGYRPFVVASSYEGAENKEPLVRRVPAGDERGAVRWSSILARWFTRFGAPYDDRLKWLPYAIAAGAQVIRSERIDAIFSTSPYLASHFAARWLSSRFRLPWVADFQDPIRDNPTRQRFWPYPYDMIVERQLFGKADRVLANTDTIAETWSKRYPKWANKISVLWNSFDPKESVPQAIEVRRSPRIMAHVGSLYAERHPTMLLSALKRFGSEAGDVRVKLVGPIEPAILSRFGDLFGGMRAQGMLEVNDHLVPRENALREIADADCLLLLDLNEMNAAFQVPSKLLDYIRAGRPILAYTPAGSPVVRILEKSGIPHVAIAPNEPESTADKKLKEFLCLPSGPHTASAWFKDNLSAAAQAKIVARLLDGILPPKNLSGREAAPQGDQIPVADGNFGT